MWFVENDSDEGPVLKKSPVFGGFVSFGHTASEWQALI
jgi:hypothetical protein